MGHKTAETARTAAALRSQLNQIAAASQMLETSTVGERSRSYLAVINQGICRMLRVVGRMELEERLSEDSPRLSPSYIDLSILLEDLGHRLESILAAIGVRFTFSCPAALLIYADSELLQQLLLELITHLALAGTEINLTAVKRDRNIHITVSDSGPGAADGRPAMPDVLETAEESLSLDLARRIADLHGGTLVVSPGADLGLSLAVSIPVNDDQPSELLETFPKNWNGGGFDPALVALSELLPANSFLPENLG